MRKFLVLFVIIIAGYVSPALAIPKDVVDRAQAAFSEQLSLDYCIAKAPLQWMARDAVFQYRLNDIDVKLRVEGRRAIAAHLCALSELAPTTVVENVRYYATLHEEIVYVQYEVVPVEDAVRRINTIAIIEMNGDQISNFTLLNRSAASFQIMQAATGDKN